MTGNCISRFQTPLALLISSGTAKMKPSILAFLSSVCEKFYFIYFAKTGPNFANCTNHFDETSILVFAVTQRGRARIAAQRSSLLQILTYLFKTNGSDGSNGGAPVVNKLIEIEKEFIKLDEEHTVRWMYIWNSYRPLVTDVFKTTDTPAMRTLSLCHE